MTNEITQTNMGIGLERRDYRGGHRYRVTHGDEAMLDVDMRSVTGTLGLLNKPALIPWSEKNAREGVFNVLEGYDGHANDATFRAKVAEVVTAASKADHASNRERGTNIHNAVDNYLTTNEYPDDDDEVAPAVEAVREWVGVNDLTIIGSELLAYSPEWRLGGTIDFLGRYPDGRVLLADFKTSKRIYSEHIIQLAAYRHMLEGMGQRVDVIGVMLLPTSAADAWVFTEIGEDQAKSGLTAMQSLVSLDAALKEVL
jgi:hypothetical protein